jgi:hypothetical protein
VEARSRDDIVTALLQLNARASVIDAENSGALEAATMAAMTAGSSLILSARLPADLAGRRVGRPDLLVAAPGGGYWPVDIKWHQNLEPATGKGSALPGLLCGLDALGRESAVLDEDSTARKREEDVLQLAHYQRMLENIDHAGGRWTLGRNHRHRATRGLVRP